MNFLCISASNVRHSGPDSTSLRICHRIEHALCASGVRPGQVETVALVDRDPKPCIGCGSCFQRGDCPHDPDFNALYRSMCASDGLFIVSPHYAPIPAKLCAVLEKAEQLAFLPRFHDDRRRSPLHRKPVGIVAHGGGTASVLDQYRVVVLDTITNALGWPVEAAVVSDPDTGLNGVLLPVEKVTEDPNSTFPVQRYDWEDISQRIGPLVRAVREAAARQPLGAGE